jgi:hypothetical protein
VIPTLPLTARNRLAETILAAVGDAGARRTLEALAAGEGDPGDWLGADAGRLAAPLRDRARRAREALARLPPRGDAGVAPGGAPPAPARAPTPPVGAGLEWALEVAAALFDAGLGFEVHELLEPYWVRASGDEREALQGLIQVAVGYQHLANGNRAGARSLLAEGARRLVGRAVRGLPMQAFAAAVGRDAEQLPAAASPPPFPRPGHRVSA